MVEPTFVVWGAFDDNPWQRLVADAVRADGMHVVTVDHGDGLEEWIARAAHAPVVVHDNWTGPIAQRAVDAHAAMRSVERHLATIDALRAAGGRLLWTMHNAAAHEVAHAEAEAALARGLASRADVVHVMDDSARALVPEAGRDRTVVVRHPSYAGVYPEILGREAARQRLRVGDGATAVLAFGVLRPYKRLSATVRGFLAARAAGEALHLLVAGRPGPGYDPAWLAPLSGRDDVSVLVDHVPELDVHVWHRAADLVAMPQQSGLTSGALMLAATFGLPVVAARSRAALAHGEGGWIAFEDPDDDAWLARGMRALREDASARASEAARRAEPETVGRAFSALVRETLTRRR